MNRRFILSAALLTPLLIAGCAVPEADMFFSSAGRFSLSGTDAEGKTFTASGRYDLRRRAGLTRLDLLTPLHGILARIEVTPDGASLTRSQDEPPVTAPDAETLMRGLLGFSFPVDALERIVLETDSPYLTPAPYRGMRNESAYIPIIADKLSSLKGVPLEDVACVTTENAERLFGI